MEMIGFSFHEVMEGALERSGERFDRPFRFDFDVRFPQALGVLSSAVGRAVGKVRIDGIAKDAPAEGTLELAPLGKRRIRYEFSFRGDDGQRYHFDGSKTIGGMSHTRGWTHLPGELRGEDGSLVGTARLRFSMKRHLRGLLGSFRLAAGRPRES
jgi:hypothetical protein